MTFTISIEPLWDEGIRSTHYGYPLDHEVSDGEDYYDLHGLDWSLVCCDGETCAVVEEDDESVTLLNHDSDMTFKLSRDEFNIVASANPV